MTNTENTTALKDLTRDQLRTLAAKLNIAGRGKMLKPELIAAIEAAQPAPKPEAEKPAEKATVVPNRADLRRKGFRNNPRQRAPKRAASNGLGAKHFLAGSTKRMRLAAARGDQAALAAL